MDYDFIESIGTGALISLFFTAVRSGIKGFMEYYLKITADVV